MDKIRTLIANTLRRMADGIQPAGSGGPGPFIPPPPPSK